MQHNFLRRERLFAMMMRNPLRLRMMLACAVFAGSAGVARAGVVMDAANVAFNQVRGGAEITYTLGDEPAIVTLEIQTNTLANGEGDWVDVGGENVQHVSGDVNCIVRETGTQRKIYWKACKDMPERIFTNGTIRAVLTAWATNAPPDYLVVGLRKSNDVRFYASTNYLPGGFSSDAYRTTELLMRKVPAAGVVWKMGIMPNDAGQTINTEGDDPARTIPHLVMLTEDYYMGVYEVTQGQYTNMCSKSNNSEFNNLPDAPLRPVESIGVAELRGQDTAFGSGIWWPKTGHQVTDDSVIGQLRAKTGLDGFDLPTSAQWEYACRAGTATAYSWGTDDVKGAYCWHSGNTTNAVNRNGGQRHAAQVVGTRLPNAWCLYDMHGNVEEICLDRITVGDPYRATFVADWAQGGVTIDPDGGEVGDNGSGSASAHTQIVKNGGSAAEGVRQMRSGARWTGGTTFKSYFIGFRLWHPAKFN